VVGFTEPERLEAAVRRQAKHTEHIQAKLEMRQAKEEQLEAGCERQRKATSQRTAGFLLLKESCLAAKGKGRSAGLEPPSAPDWKAAPSSHTSHWSTIGAQHSDPPVGTRSTATGVPTHMVTSYRRPFLERKRHSGAHGLGRPLTPSGPQWGGCEQPVGNWPKAGLSQGE